LLKEKQHILDEFAQELEQTETPQGIELKEKLAQRTKAELNMAQVRKL
jgi:hypothetical protein